MNKINNIVEYLKNEKVDGFYLKLSFLTLSANETFYSLKPVKNEYYYGESISPLSVNEIKEIFKRLTINDDIELHYYYDLNFN